MSQRAFPPIFQHYPISFNKHIKKPTKKLVCYGVFCVVYIVRTTAAAATTLDKRLSRDIILSVKFEFEFELKKNKNYNNFIIALAKKIFKNYHASPPLYGVETTSRSIFFYEHYMFSTIYNNKTNLQYFSKKSFNFSFFPLRYLYI